MIVIVVKTTQQTKKGSDFNKKVIVIIKTPTSRPKNKPF